jgi:hypothetical protein
MVNPRRDLEMFCVPAKRDEEGGSRGKGLEKKDVIVT